MLPPARVQVVVDGKVYRSKGARRGPGPTGVGPGGLTTERHGAPRVCGRTTSLPVSDGR